MIKQLALYVFLFILLSFAGYYGHTIGLPELAAKSIISLKEVYIFFGGFSLILCISFSFLYRTHKFKDQIGFLYLLSVAIKIILFCIFFNERLFFETDSLSNQEAVNLLIPMGLMLIGEVFFISKLLNNTTA